MTREWKLAGPINGLQVPTWLRTAKARYLAVATLVSVSLVYFLLYTTSTGFKSWHDVQLPGSHQRPDSEPSQPQEKEKEDANADLTTKKHPLDDLILTARAGFQRVLARRSYTVHEAARKYRQRRGRHPPPGFDKWFQYTQNKSSIVVEDFFDRIYHDLNPYWAIEPKVLRFQANAWDFVVSVRNGNSSYKTDDAKRVPWIQLWAGLIKDLEGQLPDFDMPVNMMDESRLIVPWEDIDGYMRKSESMRYLVDPKEVVTEYANREHVDTEAFVDASITLDPQFHGGQYWELARMGCHPNSTARNTPAWAPLEEPTLFPSGQPQNSSSGFVSNFTLSQQICDKPYLRGLHGTFMEPVSVSTSHKLIPLFGGSKLPINNEILIPPATYLNEDPKYSGGNVHGSFWWGKKNGVLWRGVASGGRNKAENWSHFQRHRFVQMMNGTRVKQAETTRIRAETFDLPALEDYHIKAVRNAYLGDWLDDITDVAFVELLCFPGTGAPDRCPYTDKLFQVRDGIPMSQMYKTKYLPDIDGNSFSGRYRAFLLSTSLPIKATIYKEWHDDRLFAYVHFVPMDNTYQDIYGILDYFMGYEGLESHDDMAERIAMDGKDWAEKVLRREDMAVYTYRLLLEWARICDDNRVKMGWVEDLIQSMEAEMDS
jgi:hypothetical protein